MVQILGGVVFSLETTGTEMLMQREAEGLTYYRLFMDVTRSQKEAREVNPLCIWLVI